MDYLQSPYCRLTKALLSCFGQWPYYPTLSRRAVSIVAGFISVCGVLPKVIKLINVWGDLDTMIECIPILMLDLVDFIKMANNIINFDLMRRLFDHIQEDWKLKRDEEELKVMMKYAEEGRQFSTFYTLFIYLTAVMFGCMPIIPKVLDVVQPLINDSRPSVFLFQAEYFFDQEEHFYLVLMHSYVSIFTATSILLAIDTEYATHVYHGCAIFAALRYRLEHLAILDHPEGEKPITEKSGKITEAMIIQCIVQHQQAIEFVKCLETSRTTSLFLVIGSNVAAISITGVQTVGKMNQPAEAIRFGMYTISQIFHIFFNSYPAQKLMNVSDDMTNAIYSSNWHESGNKSVRLLTFMMMRCHRPCKLTAGKIYTMSLENFTLVVKTSMSYFTVLSSR